VQSTFSRRPIRRRTSSKKAKAVSAQNKSGPSSSKATPSSNRKATKTAGSPKLQPPLTKRSKAGLTLFRFELPRAHNLVPHRRFKRDRTCIKQKHETLQVNCVVVQPRVVILLCEQGYRCTQLYDTIIRKLFTATSAIWVKLQRQLTGVTLSEQTRQMTTGSAQWG
jgi:hypothetical protein